MATVSTMGLWGRGKGQSSKGEDKGLRRVEAWNENGLRDRKRKGRTSKKGKAQKGEGGRLDNVGDSPT